MLPLLKVIAEESDHPFNGTVGALAREFALTEDELAILLPSGGQTLFCNRVGWARTYLKKAGLLEYPRRAYTRITDRGREVLAENPERITVSFLTRFEEFQAFRARTPKTDGSITEEESEKTPEEQLEEAYQSIRADLESELLQRVKECSPSYFERIVVGLLLKLGYGGSLKDAGRAIGRSGDGGIDGIIKEDRLGLDIIYIQAKRWENTVSRPEIQKFVGALQGVRARKGVFITTSSFSNEAREYCRSIDTKIILIDGNDLSELMVDAGLGVSTTAAYEIKRRCFSQLSGVPQTDFRHPTPRPGLAELLSGR